MPRRLTPRSLIGMNLLPRKCPNCDDYFTITDYHANRQTFCSKRCRSAYRERQYRMEALGPPAKCVDCGAELYRRTATRCKRCYTKWYRRQPGPRARNIERVIDYQRRNPDKRKRWQRNYNIRIGRLVPDLTELREANKRLEHTLARAAQRQGMGGAAEHDLDRGDERGD